MRTLLELEIVEGWFETKPRSDGREIYHEEKPEWADFPGVDCTKGVRVRLASEAEGDFDSPEGAYWQGYGETLEEAIHDFMRCA